MMKTMQNTNSSPFRKDSYPVAFDMYSPDYEHENCGVGFVANINGERSHQLIDDADRINRHMTHRGACGCEENTGDGAGMLTALPDEFLRKVVKEQFNTDLPEAGLFAAGVIFLPQDEQRREYCKQVFNDFIKENGQKLVGWRPLPVDPVAADIGPTALACMPVMEMLIVAAAEGIDQEEFDRKLFL
ncbi:MAG TPA: glutamate synthase subunit alpha, partial [Planctomycetaceae bacterium]|nr:glutamate synthase subunit alpha [Planctomycetaceae bacterium]